MQHSSARAGSAFLLAGALLSGSPPKLEAQLEAYLVLGTRIEGNNAQEGTATVAGGSIPIELRQPLRVPWVVGGARLSHVLYRSLALEAGYTAGWVRVSVHEVDGSENPLIPPRTGMVHTLALRPRIQLGAFGNAAAGHAFAGPVLVWRSGAGFAGYSGTLRGGWSLGLGATLRTGRLRFRADLEDVIYPLRLRRPGVLATRRTIRHDLLITIGLAIPIGR